MDDVVHLAWSLEESEMSPLKPKRQGSTFLLEDILVSSEYQSRDYRRDSATFLEEVAEKKLMPRVKIFLQT